MQLRRGDVYIVDLGDNVGYEQNGKRPCVIVQNNIGNDKSRTTIVCPISTRTRSDLPMHVPTDDLKKPSMIKCENIRSIDKSRIKWFVCRIDMTNIDKALKLILGL